MKFGVGLPICHQGVFLPTPFAGPDELIRAAQLAERLGYYSAWGLDYMTLWHDPVPPESQWPEWHETLISLGFLASQTTKIRLGTASIQLPLRDPFLFAKQVSTLDVLSKGRMIAGVGLGLNRIEFERLRPRGKIHRGALFDEYLEAMHRFFTEGAVTFEGKYYACRDVCLVPKPAQRPFPLYISGRTDDTYRRVAKWATGWLLSRVRVQDLARELDLLDPYLEKEGRSRDEIDLVVTNGLSLAKTREEAIRRFNEGSFARRKDGAAPVQVEGQTDNFIGTPDDVLAQVATLRTRGVKHCILFNYAVTSFQEMCDQIQWFGEAVLPKFAGPAARETEHA